MSFFWGGHFEFSKSAILNFFFASYQWKTQPIYTRYHFFLHYGWFFLNLGKQGRRTFMHTTVPIVRLWKLANFNHQNSNFQAQENNRFICLRKWQMHQYFLDKSHLYLRLIYFLFLLDHVSHLQSDQKRSKSNSRRTHKKRQCYYWTPHKKVRRSVLFQVYVRRQFWHFVTNLYARKSGSLINWVIPTRKTPFGRLFGWFSFFIFK